MAWSQQMQQIRFKNSQSPRKEFSSSPSSPSHSKSFICDILSPSLNLNSFFHPTDKMQSSYFSSSSKHFSISSSNCFRLSMKNTSPTDGSISSREHFRISSQKKVFIISCRLSNLTISCTQCGSRYISLWSLSLQPTKQRPLRGIPPIMPWLHSRESSSYSCLNLDWETGLEHPSWQDTKISECGLFLGSLIWLLSSLLILSSGSGFRLKRLISDFGKSLVFSPKVVDDMGLFSSCFYGEPQQQGHAILGFLHSHILSPSSPTMSSTNIWEQRQQMVQRSSVPLMGLCLCMMSRVEQIWETVNHSPQLRPCLLLASFTILVSEYLQVWLSWSKKAGMMLELMVCSLNLVLRARWRLRAEAMAIWPTRIRQPQLVSEWISLVMPGIFLYENHISL